MEIDIDLRFLWVRFRVISILIDVVVASFLNFVNEDIQRFCACSTRNNVSAENFAGLQSMSPYPLNLGREPRFSLAKDVANATVVLTEFPHARVVQYPDEVTRLHHVIGIILFVAIEVPDKHISGNIA